MEVRLKMESALKEYLDRLKGKRVAVLGIGISNTPLIHMLVGAGALVTACDFYLLLHSYQIKSQMIRGKKKQSSPSHANRMLNIPRIR